MVQGKRKVGRPTHSADEKAAIYEQKKQRQRVARTGASEQRITTTVEADVDRRARLLHIYTIYSTFDALKAWKTFHNLLKLLLYTGNGVDVPMCPQHFMTP